MELAYTTDLKSVARKGLWVRVPPLVFKGLQMTDYYSPMTKERYDFLSNDEQGVEKKLTEQEINEGWHFCPSGWDLLLIHPSHEEYKYCLCESQQKFKKENHNAKTI